jgi:hypothetical protein
MTHQRSPSDFCRSNATVSRISTLLARSGDPAALVRVIPLAGKTGTDEPEPGRDKWTRR